MREVTSEYASQVNSGARQFGFCVRVYGNGPDPVTLWLADIISVDITRSISDQLQIGACMSDRLTLRTKATTLFGGKGKKVEVFYRCTAPVLDWVLLGTFYVEESMTRDGVTTVSAYDMMSRLDKRISWSEALTFPCTMQDMLNYICGRIRTTTDFTCQNITIEKPPDGYTAREIISYIAASHGANARFSPSEKLVIREYAKTGGVINYNECYSVNIANDSGYKVKGLLFDRGGDDTVYIDDSGAEYDEEADGIVKAYDPFASVAVAEYAWSKIGGLSYSAASIEFPARNILEPGDAFILLDRDGAAHTAIVMEQSFSATFSGGFVEKISCTADSKDQTRNMENRADASERDIKSGIATKLQTGGSEYSVTTKAEVWGETSQGIILSQNDMPVARITVDDTGGLKIESLKSGGIYFLIDDNQNIDIRCRGTYINVGRDTGGIRIYDQISGSNVEAYNGTIDIRSGEMILRATSGSGIFFTNSGLDMYVSIGGSGFRVQSGGNVLYNSGKNLLWNDRTVLTE